MASETPLITGWHCGRDCVRGGGGAAALGWGAGARAGGAARSEFQSSQTEAVFDEDAGARCASPFAWSRRVLVFLLSASSGVLYVARGVESAAPARGQAACEMRLRVLRKHTKKNPLTPTQT